MPPYGPVFSLPVPVPAVYTDRSHKDSVYGNDSRTEHATDSEDLLDAAVFQTECPLGICDRNGGQQCPGVWVAWIVIHFIAFSALHDLTKVHHTDPVGNMAHHGQIMCHKQVSQSQFLLQIFQHVDNLCLDRYVQCGDRLIAEQEFRIDG